MAMCHGYELQTETVDSAEMNHGTQRAADVDLRGTLGRINFVILNLLYSGRSIGKYSGGKS